MLKLYVAAIAVNHTILTGPSVRKTKRIIKFLRGD